MTSAAYTAKQWRFFWPHATDDMRGAQWRNEPPTAEEISEWLADLPTCWVEVRDVTYGAQRKIEFGT